MVSDLYQILVNIVGEREHETILPLEPCTRPMKHPTKAAGDEYITGRCKSIDGYGKGLYRALRRNGFIGVNISCHLL